MIDEILQLDYFAAIDRHFADFLVSRFNGDDQARLLYALISSCNRAGHSCFQLSAVRELPFYDDFPSELNKLASGTFSSPAIGAPGDYRPIINDGDLWYLHRYHYYETNIARQIKQRLRFAAELDNDLAGPELDHLFGSATDIDWQRTAAALAFYGYFTIISGGPGTGKTTTVAKMLAVLLDLIPGLRGRTALAAPTGKAAARLEESLKTVRSRLGCDIPAETTTIHRLLGVRRGKPGFRHNRENRLAVDLLIIDEVSMVDLALMSSLLDAVPDSARLIMLGDKDQLASVNPGAVLADLCGRGEVNRFSRTTADLLAAAGCGKGISTMAGQGPTMQDHIVQLQTSYRYPPYSGIGQVAPLINRGQGEKAVKVLEDEQAGDIELFPPGKLESRLKKLVKQFYPLYLQEHDLSKIFAAFAVFRILVAVRQGVSGLETINNFVEKTLAEAGLIKPEPNCCYHGRPIMVTRNDYALRLFNGDTGIMLFDEQEERLLVFFQGPDGTFRKFPPARLPEHETVFAMTVHKSQGSEYDHVALILPGYKNAIVTRELLYTAVTRAAKSVTVFAEKREFVDAVHRRTRRMSGLGGKLWPSGL